MNEKRAAGVRWRPRPAPILLVTVLAIVVGRLVRRQTRAMAGSRSADPWALSWPEGSTVPRWVRDWRGRTRRPRLQISLVPHASVEHQIAMYQGLIRQWVVVITQSDNHSHDDSAPLPCGGPVRTRSYLRPFGGKGYRATVRNYMYPGEPQNSVGLSVECRA